MKNESTGVSALRLTSLLVFTAILLILLPGPAIGQTGIDSLGSFLPAAASGDGESAVGSVSEKPHYWTSSGTLVEINPVTPSNFASVQGISADGSHVVGFESTSGGIGSVECDPRFKDSGWTPETRLFSWTWTPPAGNATRITPQDEFCYAAADIANDGRVVGIYFDTTGMDLSAGRKAFSYMGGVFTKLPMGGFEETVATAISADGSVIVGYGVTGDDVYKALKWEGGNVQVIFDGEATDVSDDGSVIVGDISSTTFARWEAGAVTMLTVPSAAFGGQLNVSGDGTTVVANMFGPFGPNNGRYANVWLDDGTSKSLWELLVDADVDVGGWFFSSASAVTFDGSMIFGRDVSGFRVRLNSRCLDQAVGWASATTGDFDTGSRWEGGDVPPDTSVIAFETGGSGYMVNLTADRIDSDLYVPGDEVTLSLGQANYTLTGMCSSNSINISSGGSLTLSNGDVLAFGSVRIKGGLAPELLISSQSSLQIDSDDDENGSLMAETPNGNALVQVEMGASLTSPNSTALGSTAGTSGELSVDGAFVGGDVKVGDNGDGELFVDDDGFVAVDQLIAGKGSGSGIITVDGGRLDADEATVAEGASQKLSALTASNDAKLNFGTLTLGGAAASSGSATLTKTTLDITSMIVGREGVGDVTIGDGSTVNGSSHRGHFDLGLQSGSFGRMKIDGAQTAFNAVSMIVGDAGEGDLRLINGAKAEIDRVYVAVQEPGFLQIENSASLTVKHIDWGSEATVVLHGVLLVGTNPTAPKGSAADAVVLRADTLSVRGKPDVEVDSVAVADGGVVIGSGTFPFGLTNGGLLNPGEAAETPGQLTIGGDYVQTPDGVLEIEISGSDEAEFDRLIIGGEATLSGRLRISLIGGFEPENGQEFEIMQAASFTGELGPIEAEDMRVDLVSDGTSLKLVVLSSVANERQGDLPSGFALHQSVPNPFNARTTISYDLPTPAPVRLIVFDGLGREVRLLESGQRTAGRHEVHFDAGPLPSGTYFYRLEADGRSLSGRMVLLR